MSDADSGSSGWTAVVGCGRVEVCARSRIATRALSDFMMDVSHDSSGPDDAALGHDDDAAADVIAVAVGVLDARGIGQADAVANPRVLVDDDMLQHDVLPDAQCGEASRRRSVFVEVRPQQHRSPHGRSLAYRHAHADDRILNIATS